ncbi:FkbM family methyltransferase [Rhizobium lusitanum]|uniref:FkbM family methyltransferase n=1 Tax=Rhizobium lusitanum TaxID=293958 RepID=UPI00161160A2|nr:FkbM family methyltransferase [Rhizobium lusitanum]QND48905.1 FkbM family methyltransferase [Rhizobium lusitanum]
MSSNTIISYAQNFEDVMLWRALGHIEQGFYIDVGACSPDDMSVTKLFSERGWSGINVEPNPAHYEALKRRRPRDTNLPIALGSQVGQVDIHLFGDTGLSTLDDSIAQSHRENWKETTHTVELRRLADVWRESVPQDQPVHFLKVDVEGFERDVLLGGDWSAHRPWIVVVEATAPLSPELRHSMWEDILLNADYRFVYFDGLNRFYVAYEHADLEAAFSAPPNIFDDYISVALLERDAVIASLRDEVRVTRDTAEKLAAEHLHSEVMQLTDNVARLGVELERRTSELRRREKESANLAARAEHFEREHNILLSSKSWRLTEPLRTFNSKVTPDRRKQARRILKAAWWLVTLWRMPARLRFIRARNAAAAATGAAAMVANAPQSKYLAGVRGGVPAANAVTFPRSEKPSVTFLLDAGLQNNDVALGRTLASLRGQKPTVWEVVIYGASATRRNQPSFISLLAGDERIIVVEGVNGAAPEPAHALQEARGHFVAVLEAGDLLAPAALDEIAAALAETPQVDILYSDEDRLSEAEARELPYLKPGFSPDLLYAFNYFGRLTLLRRELAFGVGGFDDRAGTAFEWDLNLRVADAAQMVMRIPKVLCHRRPGSDGGRPAPDTPAADDARRTIETYWARRGFQATATTQIDGTQSSIWPLVDEPRVSVIIPTKDKAQLLRMSTMGLLELTDYSNLELIIVDTGSIELETLKLYDELRDDPRVRILNFRPRFNYSAACNFGAAAATGEILLFLNNDVEVISRGWLSEMVRFALRPGVGCVGVKLIFPSRELQHGGVAVGPHLAALTYRGEEALGFDLFGSPHHPRNWMAVMGACQMVTREAFDAVGGFDESYTIAMSDVALCIQLWRAGYRIAYAPDGVLVHHEGATRGHSNPSEDLRRLADDIRALGIDEDPYLHPDLDGRDATPRLRGEGGEGPRETLQRLITQFGSYEPMPMDLDLSCDGRVLALVEQPRARVLWSPQPAYKVNDIWSAARWTLDLLRRRPDISARFPRALSDGWNGAFARWLISDGRRQFGLPQDAVEALRAMFTADLGARPRGVFLWREDIRRAWPHGLTPAGRRDLFRWFIQSGRNEESLRLEEIWWLFQEVSERPEQEVITALCLTPAWQTMFGDGASPFGADRFARWFGATYRVVGPWLDPMKWPFPGSPADQIRLAWRSREDWRYAHPLATKELSAACAFLDWLASGSVPMEPWVATWLSGLDRDAVAVELVRPGFNMIAHFCYPSGLRISAEAMVEGMREIGAGVSLRDVRTDRKDDPGHERFADFETYDVSIIHTQPEPFFDKVFEKSDLSERGPRSYRVAYWYWEFDTIPDSWRVHAARVDEVWAATEFVAKGLREKLSIPVRTMFPGVRLAPFETRGRAYFGLPEDETLYLFTFHMMSIMERKNPLGLIRAFKRAFRPDEPARLVLKTSFGDRLPKEIEKLRKAAEGFRITIIDEVYSPNDVLALMETCDVYVSLHRSEGLGLTMAEAMLMGKPVVATGYSGNTEFMNEENSLLVSYKLVKLGVPIPPYEADYEWAEPSEEDATQFLRRLYDEPDFARALGRKAKADAEQRLSVVEAGRRIVGRLAEIGVSRSGEARRRRYQNIGLDIGSAPACIREEVWNRAFQSFRGHCRNLTFVPEHSWGNIGLVAAIVLR